MTIDEINQYLSEEKLKIYRDDIIRDAKGHPKCPNPVFQELLLEIQRNGSLDPKKERLYGICFRSLIEIVTNNAKFKFQDPDLLDECRLEALLALETVPKNFDATKGTAYAYVYRCCYTNMIHVLERHNHRRELLDTLKAELEEMLAIENGGRKVCTLNQDS